MWVCYATCAFFQVIDNEVIVSQGRSLYPTSFSHIIFVFFFVEREELCVVRVYDIYGITEIIQRKILLDWLGYIYMAKYKASM